MEILNYKKNIICTELFSWNLFVNETKTDNVHVFLVNTLETDDAGGLQHVNEAKTVNGHIFLVNTLETDDAGGLQQATRSVGLVRPWYLCSAPPIIRCTLANDSMHPGQ